MADIVLRLTIETYIRVRDFMQLYFSMLAWSLYNPFKNITADIILRLLEKMWIFEIAYIMLWHTLQSADIMPQFLAWS